MDIYITQLALVLIISFVVNNQRNLRQETKKKIILGCSIAIMWLVCALKKETVGIDIYGYKKIYEESRQWPWFGFHNVYFEKGYTLLMQVFSKNGVDFQIFNAFVYVVIYVPWYIFLKHFSKQPTMSIVIFICYQFWVLNMSGLRQGMAMSICLLAFMCLKKKDIRHIVSFFFLVIAASLIHRSAIVFLVAIGAYFFSVSIETIIAFFGVFSMCLFFRTSIVTMINSFAGQYQVGTEITLGGSFLMLTGFTAFSLVTTAMTDQRKKTESSFDIDTASNYMMLCALALNLVLNGSSIVRATLYASMFVTISFPNCLMRCTWKSKVCVDIVVFVFMIGLYLSDVLLPNQFNIIPYKFFWQ